MAWCLWIPADVSLDIKPMNILDTMQCCALSFCNSCELIATDTPEHHFSGNAHSTKYSINLLALLTIICSRSAAPKHLECKVAVHCHI